MSNVPNTAPLSPAPVAPQRAFLGCAFIVSFLLNVAAGIVIVVLCLGLFAYRAALSTDNGDRLREKHVSGTPTADDKVAVVSIEGIIAEGFLGFAHKQIEQAAKDSRIKAVVLRINSPGGTITASEDLYRRIQRIRDGDKDRDWTAKPLVVSMGSIAASGGYYIAVPASTLFAETTTITGSIGVYASFPNVEALGTKYGVSVKTIKAGEIKDSGSLFKEMTDKEKQVMQDMIDAAYVQFLDVVEKGRKPRLTRKKLLERFAVTPLRPDPLVDARPIVPYQRYRADGGIFTAAKAKELDLIDSVGTLEDAIAAAAKTAGLAGYHAFRYEKPRSFIDTILGIHSSPRPVGLLDADCLRAALTPRLWYLAPGHEAAGLLAAAEAAR
jgi:protease IV